MKNIVEKELCTGCRACELICPLECITMSADAEGFLYPEIDEKKCVQCGKCREVCVGHKSCHDTSCFTKHAFAAWNRDYGIRKNSSSGGIFYSLAENMISAGGVVYGAAFNTDFSVKHRRIEDIKEISALMGSKYVQSDTAETYRQVLEDLKSGNTVLYSGTPCQIAALLRFTKGFGEKLFTVSVICHGVPSPGVWKKYLYLKRGQYAESEIRKISFRDKSFGWKDFSLYIEFEKYRYLQQCRDDLYMRGFLQNLFLRPSCYQCNAKGFSVGADLIMGDFWGVERELPEVDMDSGISGIIACTLKGLELWNRVQCHMYFTEISDEAICKYNYAFGHSVPYNKDRALFFKDLTDVGLVEDTMKEYIKPDKISNNERRLYQYDIVFKYLEKKIQGFSIGKILHRFGIKRIVLYAVTELLDLALEDILNGKNNFDILISDRQFQRLGGEYRGMPVAAPQELRQIVSGDDTYGIIVCNPVRENEIIDELIAEGVGLEKIYSLVSFIFD